MIVTHDLFRPDDDVHYKDKIPVGRRFARAALHLAYGRDIPTPVPPVAKLVWRATTSGSFSIISATN